MSLIQNDDFTIWQFRTAYLTNVKDGIGERLINVNSSVLNAPGLRAAGWPILENINPTHLERTHSPPIPANTAVAAEYFRAGNQDSQNESRNGDADVRREGGGPPFLRAGAGNNNGDGENDEAAGMVTGGRRSPNIVDNYPGRRAAAKKHGKRLRQAQRALAPETREDEDSSDLSDDSDDESERAAQQIKFKKMPVRNRAGSSPVRGSDRRRGPEVLVTSPSVRSNDQRFRRSSVDAVEALKGRPRRDTTTSSEISSENEVRSESPGTKQIQFSAQEEIITPRDDDAASDSSSEKLEEEGEIDAALRGSNRDDDDWLGESVESGLFSEFGATAGSGSLLNQVGISGSLDGPSSPLLTLSEPRAAVEQPKESKAAPPPKLEALPPPRPISTVEPSSALTAMLKARKEKPANPLDTFALLSDKSLTAPLYVKIYVPSSSEPDTPLDMPMVRESRENGLGSKVMVMEAIGLALWKYVEDGIQPPLDGDKLNVNRWNLRMVEDGEVDYDFPPLGRNRPVADFTSNNNRAAAARGRSRSRPYDEFALVEATPTEFKENEKNFPKFSTAPASNATEEAESAPAGAAAARNAATHNKPARQQPMLGQPFPSALNDSSLTPADRPAVQTSHATPRMGTTKTLKIRYVDSERSTRSTTVNTSTDSYIAEILDSVCKRWGFDKGSFVLKVVDSNTVVPPDRTVEALRGITNLDLVRRRFPGGPIPFAGSPISSSPNAPLLVANASESGAKKGKKRDKDEQMLHPLAQQQDALGGYYRRYHVLRKQSMGLAAPSQRVLVFDNDYMHIMAGETGKTLFENTGKTSSVSFGDVVGSKVSRRHPKMFRVVVIRGNDAQEQKRYDFEARNAVEAVEIVDEIKKNMKHYQA